MASNIFIGLGSNLGEKEAYIKAAVWLIGSWIGEVDKISSLYHNKAWGVEDQPDFVNAVVQVHSAKSPEEILTICQRIELTLGRQPRKKWIQREIDLDLLFYDQQIINTPDLQIPHLYVEKRKFVLEPMCEISPYFRHPVHGKTMLQLSQKLELED